MNLFTITGAAIISFGVGCLTGIFGIGGGFLMTPALMILLGVPGHVAVGTDLSMICFTSTFGIIRRLRSDTIDFKLGAILASVSSIGVIAGIRLLENVKNMQPLSILGKEHNAVQYILLLVFVLLLLFIAVIMISDFFSKREKLKPHTGLFAKISFPPYIQIKSLHQPALPLIPILTLGLVVGLLTGFLGIGGGVILLPALIYLVGQQSPNAAGTSLLVVWFSTIIGVAGHIKNSNINVLLLIAMILGGLIGTHYGTVIGLKMHDNKLRFCFSFVVVVAMLIVASKIISITF